MTVIVIVNDKNTTQCEQFGFESVFKACKALSRSSIVQIVSSKHLGAATVSSINIINITGEYV